MARTEKETARFLVYFVVLAVVVGTFVFGLGMGRSKEPKMGAVVFPSVVERVSVCVGEHGFSPAFDDCVGTVYGIKIIGPDGARVINEPSYSRKQACGLKLAECWNDEVMVSRPEGAVQYRVEVVDGSRVL